jgi:DNA replication protein DnaC
MAILEKIQVRQNCNILLALCTHTRLTQERNDKVLRKLMFVLDELGYVPFSKAESELLFEVISRAYEQNSLMVTSNLSLSCFLCN